MAGKVQGKAIATKIKKWLEAVRELNTQTHPWALPITKLTSLKSLCQEQAEAEAFSLFIAQRVQTQMQESPRPERFSSEEWQTYLQLFERSIALMEAEAQERTPGGRSSIFQLLREIDGLQGDDYRNIPWGTVHWVRSGDLLKLTYALRCFEASEGVWAYKLGREYVEDYEPSYGSGIIPRSIPKLLEVAEFWCEYFFQQSLTEKFPEFFPLVKGTGSIVD
jgi:hypothetical protein